MTDKIKLRNVGDTLTLQVQHCAKATAGTYPGVEFTGLDGTRQVMVEVPEKATTRQLARLGLTYGDCVGKLLTFSRDHNPTDASKPYWSIALAPNGTAKPTTAAPTSPAPVLDEPPPYDVEALDHGAGPVQAVARQPEAKAGHSGAETTPDARLEALLALHEKITRRMVGYSKIVPLITAESFAAMVNTCFIAAERKGLAG